MDKVNETVRRYEMINKFTDTLVRYVNENTVD